MSINLTERQKNSNKNKKKIYSSALQLFDQYDFDTATVADICDNAHLSKGTFYYYFKSKEDLVIIAFINSLDKYIDQNYRLIDNLPFIEQFVDFMLCMFHFAKSVGKEFTRRSYIAQINTQIELRIEDRVMVDTLCKLIKRGLNEKKFKSDYSTVELYTVIIGTFTGILVKWCTDNVNNFDWEKFVRNQALSFLS